MKEQSNERNVKVCQEESGGGGGGKESGKPITHRFSGIRTSGLRKKYNLSKIKSKTLQLT